VVAVPLATTELGLAVSVEVALAGTPGAKVTPAVLVTAPAVAVTVLASAVVDASVATKVPVPSVVPEAGERVLPVPVAARDTAWPDTGLPLESLTTRVRVEVAAPSATAEAGLTARVVVLALGAPTVNVTEAVLVTGPTVAVTVFASALLEVKVATKVPAALVVPEAGDRVLAEPVLVRETAWPDTGLPRASNTVVVRVLAVAPSAVTELGLAARDDVDAEGAPAVKVTAAVFVTAPKVAVRVLASALVERRVHVKTPEASVLPLAAEKVFALPLLDTETACPGMRLPAASLTVTVS
jgi:hypothetical protein